MPRNRRNADSSEGPGPSEGANNEQNAAMQPDTEVTELSHAERMSAVCDLFTRGKTVKEILEEMEARYGKAGKMKRETPYKLVREAGEQGLLKFVPPPHLDFGRRISDHFFWLKRVNVVRTVVSLDVARETAAVLLRLVQECRKSGRDKKVVHIGFAAGMSMRQVAQSFAELLAYPQPGLPDRIVLHAMLSGHDPGNPTTDPNTFFTFFLHPPTLHSKLEFVGFRAPTIVRQSHISIFTEIHDIKEAYEAVDDLDIIVTSGSDWDDPHSSLKLCMKRSESTMRTLLGAGTVGDMLWRPLSATAPVTTKTEIRALTAVELGDLPAFIDRGKHVLLMMGPCGVCNRHKGAILKTILAQEQHLVSHLVTDSRTAGYLVNAMGETRGGWV